MDIIFIYITTSSYQEARNIAQKLLEEKLVACANILDGMESLYWWHGNIEQSQEAVLLVKTTKNLFDQVEQMVKSMHSYDVPCIVALPLIQVNKEYAEWISDQLIISSKE